MKFLKLYNSKNFLKKHLTLFPNNWNFFSLVTSFRQCSLVFASHHKTSMRSNLKRHQLINLTAKLRVWTAGGHLIIDALLCFNLFFFSHSLTYATFLPAHRWSWRLSKHSLFIYMNKLHVHRVNRGENIRRSLYDTLTRLRHGYGRAGS